MISEHLSFLSVVVVNPGLQDYVAWIAGQEKISHCDNAGAFRHLLSACPSTRDDRQLWLLMSHILQGLLATVEVLAEQLMALACHCGTVMVPMISKLATEAHNTGTRQLPLSLADHNMDPYTAVLYEATLEGSQATALAMVCTCFIYHHWVYSGSANMIQNSQGDFSCSVLLCHVDIWFPGTASYFSSLLQALLDLLTQLLHAAHESCSGTLCAETLQALDADSLIPVLLSLFIANDTASYGARYRAMLVLTWLVRAI